MKAPRKRNAGPRQAGAANIKTATKTPHQQRSADHRQEQQVVVVGSFVAPAGRRTLPASMAICPDCQAATLHRPVCRGMTDSRTGTCGHQYLLHVEGTFYGVDRDDTDLWVDQDGAIYRGNQAWIRRVV